MKTCLSSNLFCEGQISSTHLDDKGQSGTFALLDIIAPASFPAGTCIHIREPALHCDHGIYPFGYDDNEVAQPGLDLDRGIALQFARKIKGVITRAGGKIEQTEVGVRQPGDLHIRCAGIVREGAHLNRVQLGK